VRQWALGVTIAPRRQPTHDETLDHIRAAGWDDFHLFTEPDVELAARHDGLPRTRRPTRYYAWKNWFAALGELWERYPGRDAYGIIQDDVLLCRNIRAFLEEQLWPADDCGVASVYCPSHYERDAPGWYARDTGLRLRPALTFFFPPASVESILAHPTTKGWPRRKNIDNAVGLWARETRRLPYFFSPSLAQHVGETSTIVFFKKLRGKRISDRFVGDDFDALALTRPEER
jgi:hypothetical protein